MVFRNFKAVGSLGYLPIRFFHGAKVQPKAQAHGVKIAFVVGQKCQTADLS